MRISYWSSDVCSSDLPQARAGTIGDAEIHRHAEQRVVETVQVRLVTGLVRAERRVEEGGHAGEGPQAPAAAEDRRSNPGAGRIEDGTFQRQAILFPARAAPVLVTSGPPGRSEARRVGKARASPSQTWW